MSTKLVTFLPDILEQPAVLRQQVAFYRSADGQQLLNASPKPNRLLLTGMGASYQAALYASYLFHSLDLPALAVEAVDLIHYSAPLLNDVDTVIFISQSGASAEVIPVLERLPAQTVLLALTNHLDSPLAQKAQVALPLLAGSEKLVATKTYLNSLACLWLLAQHWAGHSTATSGDTLLRVADAADQLLDNPQSLAAAWIEQLASAETLFFLGHGPHIATARQAAMMLGEWPKRPSIATSIGAFRHGLIEIAGAGTSAVLFGWGGLAQESVKTLANELRSYQTNVLLVVEGKIVPIDSLSNTDFPEMLTPLLDIIPAQLFAEALVAQLGQQPGFRYIRKVVTQL